MAKAVAFELKADYKDSFAGGSITLRGGGRHFDIGAALKEGNGRIVTDDDRVVEALRTYDALKRVDPGTPDKARDEKQKPTTNAAGSKPAQNDESEA